MNNNAETVKIALDIKNEYTENMAKMIFDYIDLGPHRAIEKANEKGIEALAQCVTGAFTVDLFEGSAKKDTPLDLTYNTVNGLIDFAVEVYKYNINVNRMEPAYAKRLFCRMLAAYLIYLCANEHGCKLDVNMLYYEPSPSEDEKYWSSALEIKIGKKSKVDFLVAAIKGAKCTSVKNMLTGQEWYCVEPLVEAYEKATGVNLTEMGFRDVVLG